MGQCLSNFFGKDSSAAKQYHPYYELQICERYSKNVYSVSIQENIESKRYF